MITYFKEVLNIIADSIHSMDEAVFRKLLKDSVDTLETGHKIIVSGLGKNVPICEKFVGSMNSLGMNACFLNTNSAVHGDMGVIKAGDLLILLTKSGETEESVYLADKLPDKDIKLWLLTFNREGILTNKIPNSLVLDLKHEGDLWNVMPNNSTTMNLIVLQALVMRIAKERKVTLEDFKRNHPGGHIGEVLRGEFLKDEVKKSDFVRRQKYSEVKVSPLGKTWILDLDGTLVKHNGYRIDGRDTFLEGAEDFLRQIPKTDMIVFLTSRTDRERELTEMFLSEHNIRYDAILYHVPYGERILMNDRKPSGLDTAIAVNLERDVFANMKFIVEESL